MQLKSIDIQGFKSFQENQKLDLLSLRENGFYLITGENLVDTSLGANGCLVGDTEIDLPRDLTRNNSGIKIKDLVGKEFYTYCFDIKTNSLKLKRAFNVRKTGIKKEVWKVSYKGNKRKGFKDYNYIIATPNHLFLKSDGTYVPLRELKINDSIMSFYRRAYDSYAHIRATCGEEYYEHKFIVNELYKNSKNLVGHHKDHTKLNNSIENIDPMLYSDHCSYHAKYGNNKGYFQWKVHPKGFLGKKRTEEQKDKIRKTIRETYKNNPDILKRRKESVEKYWDAHPNGVWRNKELLIELYLNKKLSTIEIGKKLNCSSNTILRYLKKYSIPIRTFSEATINSKRNNNHKVISITFYGYEDVYDMEVEDCHNFVANGLFVHNSGKSSLVEALCWVFFGKTSTNLVASDIANWVGNEQCKVEVSFDEHILTRTWNPNTLVLDGNTISQEQLEKEIGYNFKSFLYSVLISQFTSKLFDLSPSEKLEVFTEIMDDIVSEWDDYSTYSKTCADERELEISDLEKELAKLYGKKSVLESIDYKVDSLKWEESIKERRISLVEEVAKVDKELEDAQESVDLITKNNEQFQKEIDTVKEDLGRLREVRTKEQENYHALQAEAFIIDNSVSSFKETLQNWDDLKGKCPICTQNVSSIISNRNKVTLKSKIKDLENKWKEKKKEVETSISSIKSIEESIRIQEDNFDALRKKLLSPISPVQIQRIQNRLDLLSDQLNKLYEEKNPFNSIEEDNKNKLRWLDRKITYKKDLLETTVKEQLSHKYWGTKGYKEIKLLVIKDALKELEISINNNLTKLGMPNWTVELEVDSLTRGGKNKKGFTVLVKSPINDKLVPFSAWSGGEGQRLRLAGTLGLIDFIENKRGINLDLEIFDEPTAFLSETGIEDLLYLFHDRAKEHNKKIFIIDHRNFNSLGIFSGIIKIIKSDKGSRISQE